MLQHPETISYDKVKTTIESLTPEEQELPALAYATGSRVSELNKITKKDFFQEQDYLYIYCTVLKKRKKAKQFRKAVVRMDEKWLVTPILNKVNSLKNPDDILFPQHRVTLFRKLIKLTGWNPHGFRKLRATHLRKNFGFDAYQLQQFFDWASIEPSGYYVKLDAKEILY